MSQVRPFRALRPAEGKAEQVISLPYDVMNRAEAAAMAEGNPCSFLHICRSEIDLPEEDAYAPVVYQKAKENLGTYEADGILNQDPAPYYYIYREVMDGRPQTGIVACVSVDDYENNIIKKHELTRAEKEQDRINHFDACDANTEPVFLTYRDNDAVGEIIAKVVATKPVYDLVSSDGIGHTLWVVDDAQDIAQIQEGFKNVPYLYIADGHHRSASAFRVAKKRRAEHPDYTGEEEFNFFMAVIFPESELLVMDYNRVVKDLNGKTEEEFMAAVREAGFELEAMGTDAYRPSKKHEFSMFMNGVWYKLTATDAIVPQDDVIGSLDVSVLQNNLLAPILGIGDPRTDKRIDFVGGIRGLGELERRVNSDMKLAIAVYPVSVEDLMEVADQGLTMPPKSTWFEPKLGSGLFVHKLTD